MSIDLITAFTQLASQYGAVGVLIPVVGVLLWFIRSQTVPKGVVECMQERLEDHEEQIQSLREDWDTIAPSMQRIGDLQEKQLAVMEETLKHVNDLESRFDEADRYEMPVGRRRRREE